MSFLMATAACAWQFAEIRVFLCRYSLLRQCWSISFSSGEGAFSRGSRGGLGALLSGRPRGGCCSPRVWAGQECEDCTVGAGSRHWQPGVAGWSCGGAGAGHGAADSHQSVGQQLLQPAVEILLSRWQSTPLCLGLAGWCWGVTAILSAAPPMLT